MVESSLVALALSVIVGWLLLWWRQNRSSLVTHGTPAYSAGLFREDFSCRRADCSDGQSRSRLTDSTVAFSCWWN